MSTSLDLVQSIRSAQNGGYMPEDQPGPITHADGDAMRARILRAIAESERPFNTWAELAEAVGSSDSNVQYHVKRLRKMGRVEYEDRRPWTLRILDQNLTL